MNIVRAERTTVEFCQGVSVDGYRLPSGEFRVGKTGAAIALGYSKEWTGRIISAVAKNKTKDAQTLTQWGFSGVAYRVKIEGAIPNIAVVQSDTLSLKDFRQLIKFAAKKGKPQAEALLDALLDVTLEDWFRLAFGEDQLTLEEKRARFYKAYAATLNWLEEDRAEWAVIFDQEMFALGYS